MWAKALHSSTMNDVETEAEELNRAIQGNHFSRAALLARSMGRPERELRDLQRKALWQMAAIYRNPQGTKTLSMQYDLPKDQVREILERTAEEKRREGDDKSLGACYDLETGKYLTLQEWMEYYFKNWDKIGIR